MNTPSWQHLKKGYSATKKRQLRKGIKAKKIAKKKIQQQQELNLLGGK